MRMRALGVGIVGAWVCGLAGASVAQADPEKPAWCADPEGRMSQYSAEDTAPDKDLSRQLRAVVYTKCHPFSFTKAQQATINAQQQRLEHELGLTDADWADVADYARSGQGAIVNGDVRVKDDKAAWGARDAVEQFATFQAPTLRTPGLNGELDPFYLADLLGPKLSASGRLSFVRICLKSENPVVWAMCQGDIAALDLGKIEQEVRADKGHDGFTRMVIRIAAREVKAKLPERADAIAKLIASDKAWKQVFDIAAEETKAWDKRYADRADLIALGTQLDDALVTNSRSASEGCEDKTWTALADVIKKTPAKAFVVKRDATWDDLDYTKNVIEATLGTIVADPDGYLAATAYATCHVLNDGDGGGGKHRRKHDSAHGDPLAEFVQYRLMQWPGFRGPRTAALSRIELADVKFDDRDTKLDSPRMERFWYRRNSYSGSSEGTVAGVKTDGDEATISFQAVKVKATVDTGCSQGRLHGIRGDGSLEYEINCTGSKQVTYDRTREPETVDARFAAGLKAGMDAVTSKGMVWIAWPKPGVSTPSLVLGQPVK